MKKYLRGYFAGKPIPRGSVKTLPPGTPFQKRVWKALLKVGWGQTVSYGKLARLAGCPRAARAVGRAVAANPLLIFIPCHRVIAHDGSLGGFSAGLRLKRRLLRHEQTKPVA